ncbi:hypothetical protein QE410_002171 [Microbacterium sp. SORGH_AS 1204]|uniref:DUF4395 domain-containing protein n=1 Tax=Microbacterium sp. SORGH_AS_1204 TaxID=3041785 RepID=UPI00278FCD5C|nr:DUF4395 domain-containing protein [Microbacterium sp. SORGH_AS_1204]MDQ1137372.1 hypothetical protein [Microbacterium sp. SORGH_AS_1204]
MAEPARIDARGPRFAASLTAVLLLAATTLGLVGISTQRGAMTFPVSGGAVASHDMWALPAAPLLARVADPGFLLLLVCALLFVWGVAAPRTAPWGVVYRRVVQPRLAPPTEFEDPRPPRFAQGVGLLVTTVGLLLHLAGVAWALPIAAAMAFVAAFLNAVFGLCLGCQLYLLLQRVGVVGRRGPAAA